MSFIAILAIICIVGVATYFIPMDRRFKTLVFVVMAVVAAFWLINYFGLWPYLTAAPLRRR